MLAKTDCHPSEGGFEMSFKIISEFHFADWNNISVQQSEFDDLLEFC